MAEYKRSETIQEINLKYPFPWQEQQMVAQGSVLVRMLDARGNEVPIFEMTGLCVIITAAQASRASKGSSP